MLTTFLNNIFPRRCASCKTPGIALCNTCSALLKPAKPGSYFALYDYGGVVREGVRSLKYNRRSELAQALALRSQDEVSLWLSEILQTLSPQHIFFVPIPLSRSRLWERGFNQSTLLAKWLGHGIVTPILRKIKRTLPQVSLNKYERGSNVACSMKPHSALDPHSLYVIIDDVTTTGATFHEAVRALKEGGARNITCLALAHGSFK